MEISIRDLLRIKLEPHKFVAGKAIKILLVLLRSGD